jgi:ubiquinone/menaquinone biosynthesis C-methylase UbiE
MTADRLTWAVDRLAVGPGEHVLELGSGHGVAASSICARGGTVVGLDRSATMTAAASRRNAQAVQEGRARFVTAAVEDADLADERVDKVLAIRFPPLLRGDAGPALALVRRHLAPGGALYVAEQPPGAGGGRRVADAIAARLEKHGFVVGEVVVEDGGPARVCVVGRPG